MLIFIWEAFWEATSGINFMVDVWLPFNWVSISVVSYRSFPSNNLKMFLLCKYYTIQQLFSSSCFACRSFGPPRLKICQSYWKFIGPVFLLTLFIVSQQCCLQNLLVLQLLYCVIFTQQEHFQVISQIEMYTNN
jgi:hypothetical protein